MTYAKVSERERETERERERAFGKVRTPKPKQDLEHYRFMHHNFHLDSSFIPYMKYLKLYTLMIG